MRSQTGRSPLETVAGAALIAAGLLARQRREPSEPRARHRDDPHAVPPAMAAHVPLVDRVEGNRIYTRAIPWLAFFGALLGAVILGVPAYLFATGAWPIVGLGQYAASGVGLSTFTGAGVGAALGGLAGALVATFRLPMRVAPHYGRDHHERRTS